MPLCIFKLKINWILVFNDFQFLAAIWSLASQIIKECLDLLWLERNPANLPVTVSGQCQLAGSAKSDIWSALRLLHMYNQDFRVALGQVV